MKKALRILGWAVGSLAALLVVGFVIGAYYYRDIPAATLEKKYGNTESKFVMLDGVRMHYRDEGPTTGDKATAPTIVLIHAHFDNLISWDPWVEALKDKYRVIRFDFTSHGLTGVDPSGDYSLKRTVDLVEMLADQLQLGTFSMAGTSMGGTIAIHYATRHPEKVEKMILLSPGALNTRVRGRDTPPPLPPGIDIVKYITPRLIFKGLLTSGFGDKSKVTDQLIDQWWEMMRREGQREAELTRQRQYISGDVDAKIRTITQPTLILWGEANSVVTVDQARQLVDLMTAAKSVKLITYPGVGHMAVHEAPEQTARDARAFFDEPIAAIAAPDP
ncbi:MAG: alpha/beta hydrolase, partial [Rhodospirillaceae bacterium]|nr:alpha/beta hydrolase [Rhodospirillaceae bacterium]